jgi:hypothetical protein
MKINIAPDKPKLKFSDIKVGQPFAFAISDEDDFTANGIFVRMNSTEEQKNCVDLTTGRLEFFVTDNFSQFRLVQIDEVTILP